MIKSKKGVLIALIIPILALVLLIGEKEYQLLTGKEITLPITGYDPRDLLAGHYLTYTIDYGVEGICNHKTSQKQNAYICLQPKQFSYKRPNNCELMIKGICNRLRFEAGINRYYVPKKDAKKLEKLIRANKASIVLSVPKNGKAQIKDLLINGTSWKKLEKIHNFDKE